MNAGIEDMKTKPITWNELNKDEQIEIAPTWERQSQDKTMNAQGRELCNLMDGGMRLYPLTNEYTYHTANSGHSVVDYALVHINAMRYVDSFELGHRVPESDHVSVHMHLDFDMSKQKMEQAAYCTTKNEGETCKEV